jgi:uncharacterized membrane protein
MGHLVESLFEFLFKYRPIVYREGDFTLAASPATITGVAIAIAAGVLIALTYAWVRVESRRRDRALLATSRVALLALLGFCLMAPSLTVSTLLEQRSYLAVLVDDSRSMSVRDEGDSTRAEAAAAMLAANAKLRNDLESRFNVRYFRFSDGVRPMDEDTLQPAGGVTDIGGALEHVLDDLSGLPLAGMVVLSDGADNAQRDWRQSLLPLRAAQIPVFTVVLGRESGERDVQVSRVAMPSTVLKDATVVADVEITHPGYGGENVRVEVEDAGRLLARETIRLERGTDFTHVALAFPARESGARQLRVRVAPTSGEKQLQNNERPALLEVRDRREKILMVEGEPRFETKFIRRALEGENQLQLVVFQRTAPKKFMRLDVDSAAELASGFPTSRAELFSYRGLVLGSIEASFFTHEQLQMIADFVSRRGGGLLMLGGPNSFSEGGWAGTPVAEVLPVTLTRGSAPRPFTPAALRPTEAGFLHPIIRIDSTEQATRARWNALPQLSTTNDAGTLKAGATVLLASEPDNAPVLAYQRYGRGVGLTFSPQDSWLYQMHADIAVEDQTHEVFWRQLLRYLVQDVPEPVRVVAAGVGRVQQPFRFAALAEDSAYSNAAGTEMSARITGPDGTERSIALPRAGSADGAFNAAAVLTQPGLHEINVEATRNGAIVGRGRTYVSASDADLEFFDAQARPATLARIAEETGGRAYAAPNVASLPEDIRLLGRGAAATERKDLWDMPAIFLALLLLACAEWLYRRRKGLI